MTSPLTEKLSIKDKGLRYKLSVIKILVFALPYLVLSYILHKNKIFLESSQIVAFALTLFLILVGLILLRQIFDRISVVATSIKNAEADGTGSIDTQQDTTELHEIAVSFNNLMKKFEQTTSELQHRVFELLAIKELIEVASKNIHIDGLLNALLEKAMAVCKAEIGSVFMVESREQAFRVVATRGLESGPAEDSYISISQTLARHVISARKPLLVQGCNPDTGAYKLNDPKYGPASFISMPIFIRENLIATLNLSHRGTKRVFGSNDEHILSIMIGEVGFALENAQLHAEAKEHVRTLQESTAELSDSNAQLRQEINERKRAEEALNLTNKFLKNILDSSSSISIISTDNESNILFWNKGAENMLGYKAEEMVGREKIDRLYSEDQKKSLIEKTRSSILEDRKQVSCEVREIRKDGRKLWVDLTLTPRFDDRGQVVGILGIGEDITERKLAEEKLKEYSKSLEVMVEQRTKELNRALHHAGEARDRMDAILKSIADGLIVTNKYYRVILMNRAAEDLLGVRLSEVIDRPIDFAIEDETLRERIKTTLNKKKEGYEFDFELPEANRDRPRVMRARTSVITDKAGKQTGIITTMHDVTYEREADRMKTEFISTAAHELRTPLTSIQGFSEILSTRDDLKEEERGKFLSYINRQSMNLANIINDLLNISRIESGRGYSLEKAPTDIAHIIRDKVPYFQVQSRRHQFDLILPEESVEAVVDEEKMGQVLENILSNAVKYSPEGGRIRITGGVVQDDYQVSVEDQGIGMSPEQLERIFDRFYRADASNTAIPGTGLGMSIVKHILDAHGGKVWVESELGKGTTVRFSIPIESKSPIKRRKKRVS